MIRRRPARLRTASKAFEFEGDVLLVGRKQTCDIVVNNQSISSDHASVRFHRPNDLDLAPDASRWVLTGAGGSGAANVDELNTALGDACLVLTDHSRNGSFVNDKLVHRASALLWHRDHVRFGRDRTVYRVELGAPLSEPVVDYAGPLPDVQLPRSDTNAASLSGTQPFMSSSASAAFANHPSYASIPSIRIPGSASQSPSPPTASVPRTFSQASTSSVPPLAHARSNAEGVGLPTMSSLPHPLSSPSLRTAAAPQISSSTPSSILSPSGPSSPLLRASPPRIRGPSSASSSTPLAGLDHSASVAAGVARPASVVDSLAGGRNGASAQNLNPALLASSTRALSSLADARPTSVAAADLRPESSVQLRGGERSLPQLLADPNFDPNAPENQPENPSFSFQQPWPAPTFSSPRRSARRLGEPTGVQDESVYDITQSGPLNGVIDSMRAQQEQERADQLFQQHSASSGALGGNLNNSSSAFRLYSSAADDGLVGHPPSFASTAALPQQDSELPPQLEERDGTSRQNHQPPVSAAQTARPWPEGPNQSQNYAPPSDLPFGQSRGLAGGGINNIINNYPPGYLPRSNPAFGQGMDEGRTHGAVSPSVVCGPCQRASPTAYDIEGSARAAQPGNTTTCMLPCGTCGVMTPSLVSVTPLHMASAAEHPHYRSRPSSSSPLGASGAFDQHSTGGRGDYSHHHERGSGSGSLQQHQLEQLFDFSQIPRLPADCSDHQAIIDNLRTLLDDRDNQILRLQQELLQHCALPPPTVVRLPSDSDDESYQQQQQQHQQQQQQQQQKQTTSLTGSSGGPAATSSAFSAPLPPPHPLHSPSFPAPPSLLREGTNRPTHSEPYAVRVDGLRLVTQRGTDRFGLARAATDAALVLALSSNSESSRNLPAHRDQSSTRPTDTSLCVFEQLVFACRLLNEWETRHHAATREWTSVNDALAAAAVQVNALLHEAETERASYHQTLAERNATIEALSAQLASTEYVPGGALSHLQAQLLRARRMLDESQADGLKLQMALERERSNCKVLETRVLALENSDRVADARAWADEITQLRHEGGVARTIAAQDVACAVQKEAALERSHRMALERQVAALSDRLRHSNL